jgi:hypothetical protein
MRIIPGKKTMFLEILDPIISKIIDHIKNRKINPCLKVVLSRDTYQIMNKIYQILQINQI